MAKYNLMDTEKPEYFDRYFDEDEEQKDSQKQEEVKKEEPSLPDMDEREYFDDSLFNDEATPAKEPPPTPDALENLPPEQPLESQPTEDSPAPIQEEPSVEPPPAAPKPPQTDLSEIDYEDSKMQGINWKPLLIWGTVVIAIIVVIFVGYKMFFSDDTADTGEQVEKPVLSPEEQRQQELERKKIAFLNNVVLIKKDRLNKFSTLSNLKTSGVSYSSILLYDDSFNFEIFGQRRDDIATYNQNLKNNNLDGNFKIQSVSNRPGSNGGIFALYSAKVGSGGTAAGQSQPSIDNNIQNSIQNLINSSGLSITSERIISRKKVDQFNMVRKEIICKGPEKNSVEFLKNLSTSNKNFGVHKISMVASNQKNIKNSKYNLLIIFDFYM